MTEWMIMILNGSDDPKDERAPVPGEFGPRPYY